MARVHVVMGVLARGARHGYALRRELRDALGPDWELDFGQLYRLLAVMRRRRWVRARREAGARGPQRTVYALTASGRRELDRWLADAPAARARDRDEQPPKRHLARALGHAGAATRESAQPGALLAVGSDDAVVALVARELGHRRAPLRFADRPIGSLGGLVALAEGRAQLAGVHLLDPESGEYNLPFAKLLLAEQPCVLLTLAHREQGLLVAAGNPLCIRGVGDLARPRIRLVNRQPGAGTRALLCQRLRGAGIEPQAVAGYDRVVHTHTAVAAAIAAGSADVGLGIRAAAVGAGLDFIAIAEERYDLVIPRALFEGAALRPLRELLHDRAFRRAAALPGYDLRDMGRVAAGIG